MIRDGGVPIKTKTIKDRVIGWKEFFEVNLNHDTPIFC